MFLVHLNLNILLVSKEEVGEFWEPPTNQCCFGALE
jgi:hypothetical protein